jgi:hypothetical protein
MGFQKSYEAPTFPHGASARRIPQLPRHSIRSGLMRKTPPPPRRSCPHVFEHAAGSVSTSIQSVLEAAAAVSTEFCRGMGNAVPPVALGRGHRHASIRAGTHGSAGSRRKRRRRQGRRQCPRKPDRNNTGRRTGPRDDALVPRLQ